ncbi:MAG: Tfp pilus assembly protein FimT/FimU [Alcanivoracaceae bacterium]
MARPAQTGFTIVELMLVLAVLGTVLAFGVPQFRELRANAALRGTTMDLVAALNLSRAEAVSLRATINVVPLSGSAWSSGWSLEFPADRADDNRSFNARPGVQVVESAGLAALQFRANGTVSSAAEFTICDGRGGERGRRIRINQLGRMNNEEIICP